MPSARRLTVIVSVGAVVLLAGFVRLHDVGDPERIYFDETYYVADARAYLDTGVEEVRPAHPPLGKWVIAAGIAAAGDDPVGWRVANVVAGTVTVALAVVAGRLLTGVWWPGILAGLLLALDGLSVVSSRIGMLDAPLALFVAAAFVLLLVDLRRGDDPRRAQSSWAPSWWRLGAAGCLGLAVATKWSGVLALAGAVCVAALVDVARARAPAADADEGRPSTARLASRLAVRVAVPFTVIPLLLYLAAYVPWMAGYEHTETATERCELEGRCGDGIDDRVAGWWYEQRELVAFHQRLEATHPDRSSAWRWPLLQEPVQFYLERCAEGATRCPYDEDEERQILGLGNPGLWWPALAAVPALGVVAWRRRWWGAGLVLAFVASQWAPWLLAPKPGFSFYLIPVAPFVALAVALLCWHWRSRGGRVGAVALAAVVAVAFLVWHPLLVGSPVGEDGRERLALLPSWE